MNHTCLLHHSLVHSPQFKVSVEMDQTFLQDAIPDFVWGSAPNLPTMLGFQGSHANNVVVNGSGVAGVSESISGKDLLETWRQCSLETLVLIS